MWSMRVKMFLLKVIFTIEVNAVYDSLKQGNQTIIAYRLIQLEDTTTSNPKPISVEEYNEYYEQIQGQEKQYQNTLSPPKILNEEINYNFSSSDHVTESSSYTKGPYYTQMFADMNKSEEEYSMENDSRLYEENKTLYSIKENIYAEKMLNLSKNTSEDNQMRVSYEEYIDQLTIDTTTIASPIVRKKQGKQIPIIKLLSYEALRNYIEDSYIRTPLAAIVDTSPNSLDKTKLLWKDALKPNAALDIVLLAFNSSGVAVTYHFQNTRTFLAGLESLKDDSTGDTFYAIIKASELVPYDSAIFVSTAIVPTEENLALIAATTLLKKRIRLYLIWFGEKCFNENKTQGITGGVLGEVAIRSGGEILYIHNRQSGYFEGKMVTFTSEKYNEGQQVQIPLGTTRSNLRLRIDGTIQSANLETPSGGTEIFDNTLESINLAQMFNDKTTETEENEYFLESPRIPSESQNKTNFSMFHSGQKTSKQVATSPYITKIDISLQSQLLVAPGMISKIYFEISNLRNEEVSHNIQVTDEKRFLQSLNPQRVLLSPGQTIIAFVTAIVPLSVPQGTTDRITFTCLGNEPTSQSLLLKVLSGSEPIDITQPSLTWTFGSRCDIEYQTSCTDRIWNLNIVGQDWESGILRILSNRNRVFHRQDFTIGTTDAVRVSYSASCCEPRVTLTAYDLAGNQKSVTIDIRDVLLTEASITAIALGVILLLLLIIIVIGLIVWCRRKQRDSRDLSL